MTDPIQTAADALAVLSPEDRERALTLARDLPTEPGYYYAKDQARHGKPIVVEVFQRDGYLFVRFFGVSDAQTVQSCTHLDWGPRVPEWGTDAYAAAPDGGTEDAITLALESGDNSRAIYLLREENERLRALRDCTSCPALDAAFVEVVRWRSLCESLGVMYDTAGEDIVKAIHKLKAKGTT